MKRLVRASLIGSLLFVLLVGPAYAAELTGGCVLQVRSFDGPGATGTVIDEGQASGLIAEGAVGSQADPFQVDPDGSVDFLFTTPTVFQDNHWSIHAQGLPIPILLGQDDNPLDLDETGVVEVSETAQALPFRFVGTLFISGDIWGNNDVNRCHGEGFVRVLGDPIGTVPWIVAVALIVLGGVGLLVATPYTVHWEVDQTSGERLHTGPIST